MPTDLHHATLGRVRDDLLRHLRALAANLEQLAEAAAAREAPALRNDLAKVQQKAVELAAFAGAQLPVSPQEAGGAPNGESPNGESPNGAEALESHLKFVRHEAR